jgi:DNA-binding transcriptional ArsR family regulator
VDAALKALAEPRRREILRLVWSHELPATDIADRFRDVSRPAISQHLRILKQANLVLDRPEGNRRLYQINPAGFDSLREYFEQFWSQALDAFKKKVEERPN